jgi:beta-mannosidase
MTRTLLSLNDSHWRFGSVAQKPFGDVNDLDAVTEWLPAQVPGDVRLDLLRAGKISDPFFADNNEQSQWIDARDWWYVHDLALDLRDDERAFLIFEGIDYQSAIFVNGEPRARHVGMFSRQIIELTNDERRMKASVVRPSSFVAVRLWGSDALPELHKTLWQKIWARLVKPLYSPPSEPFPDRYATLKCQMQFGWDFAPRLRTCGIWDDAYIVITRSVFIEEVWVKATARGDNARVQMTLTLDADRERNVRVVCVVRGKNFACAPQTFEFAVHLTRGKQTRTLDFDLCDAQLWQPWDRGAPNVYAIEIRLLDGARVLDECVETFGVREFTLTRAEGAPPDAEPWQFVINGAREFLRGANWVPLDAIPARLTRADYAARLQQARDANINFLRVWGGGLREKRAFYDVCDELGILVWQEFPFSGTLLDHFPRDRAWLDFVRAECGEIVRALRNHPSLVVWCGGNEFSVSRNRAIVNTLRAVVEEHDGTRPFKPASPYRDESHNWRVWHRRANLRDYRKDTTPFLSEFGLQSLPNLESLQKFLPADALIVPHALWVYHRAELKKLLRYAQSPISNLQSPIPNLQSLISSTQRAQSHALQIAIEHLRRRKPRATGVAVWQFNDCWPSISWSVVDYYGVPKRAYWTLQRVYAPLLASFEYDLQPRRAGDVVRGTLWLVNDLRAEYRDAAVRAELDGAEIFAQRVHIAPDSVARIGALNVTLGEGENILRVRVVWREQTLAENEYDLNFCDVGEISWFGKWMVTVARFLLR